MSVPALTLRPRQWQERALQAWNESGRRGIAKVATGGGKTVFAELCMSEVLKSEDSPRFIILVPTLSLLDQWALSLEEEFNVPSDDIALWSGGKKPKEAKSFNIAVINSARTLIGRMAEGNEPVMLIVDEVHRAASAQNAKALEGTYIATLGLSATPERQFDDLFEEVLKPRIGPVVFEYDIISAAKDGILSRFEAINVEFELLADEAHQYNELSARIARRRAVVAADDEILEALLRKRARVAALATMRAPLATRLCEQHKGARTLIFHEDIGAARTIHHTLIARNHAATTYHSRIAGPRRRENLRMFRKGIFDVLVCCRALDEGLNVPEVQVAIIASSTSSTRQRIQRLGRVLRPHASKERASVYTLFATRVEKDRLAQEAIALQEIADVRWAKVGRVHG